MLALVLTVPRLGSTIAQCRVLAPGRWCDARPDLAGMPEHDGADDAGGGASRARRGHEALAHTADVMIEAWGASRAECLEEAVAALAELYVEAPADAPTTKLPVSMAPGSGEEMLVALLQSAATEPDLGDLVVVAAELRDLDGGGLTGLLLAVPVGAVEVCGAVPKGVSRSGIELRPTATGWRARAVIDV